MTVNQKRDRKSRAISVWLVIVLLVAAFLRIAVIFTNGPFLTLHSDDEGYYHSAQWLLKYGTYAYYSPKIPTVHMMPGIVLYLSLFIHTLGTGVVGYIAARVGMIAISLVGMFAVYLLGRKLWSPWAGLGAAFILALYLPSLVTDNLFLTETPFMTAFLYLVYTTLKAVDDFHPKWVSSAAILYVVCIYFRPTVALFPVVVLLYFLTRRYPLRLLLRHAAAGLVIVVLLMSPWWIRNEMTFQRFIPTTDGMGNPLLLGTFQGTEFPGSTTSLSANQVLEQIVRAHPDVLPKSEHSQTLFEYQQKVAITRMQHWWNVHPADFYSSYLRMKPLLYWSNPYYPVAIWGITVAQVQSMQSWVVLAGLFGWLICLIFGTGRRRESAYVLLTLLYYTVLYSFFFVYGRYNEPLMPLLFLGITGGVYSCLRALFRTRAKAPKRNPLRKGEG